MLKFKRTLENLQERKSGGNHPDILQRKMSPSTGGELWVPTFAGMMACYFLAKTLRPAARVPSGIDNFGGDFTVFEPNNPFGTFADISFVGH